VRIVSIECLPVGWRVEGELRWGRMAVRRKGAPLIRVTTDAGVQGIGEAGFSIDGLIRQESRERSHGAQRDCPPAR
jgi:L-alanine-DL-glutamate epimerase-like enolase superfamily enzyme